MSRIFPSGLATAILLLIAAHASAQAQAVPLVAAYNMQTAGNKLIDQGPLHYDGTLQNVTVSQDGHPAPSLHFDGPNSQVTIDGPFLQKLASDITLTAWINVERYPEHGGVYLISKGGNQGFQLGLGDNHAIFFHGFWGGWYDGPWGGKVPPGRWTHVAFTFRAGDQGRLYVNGTQVASVNTPYAFWPVGDPLKLGGSNWAGLMDEVHVYAAQLTPAQVQQDMQGVLPGVRTPLAADFPAVEYPVHVALTRFDEPIGMAEFIGRSRQTAQRVPGPDAVDWPQLTLHTTSHTTPLWRESAEQDVTVPLPPDNARPLFRQPWDNTIEPVDNWFRAQPWIWNQVWVYSNDLTSRTGAADYELWTFPVKIAGTGDANLKQVTLRLDGQAIYDRTENLRSLTLLLPQNPAGHPYELTVNGRGPVTFSAGLVPPEPGNPQFVPIRVNLAIPGEGPAIHVSSIWQPAQFPNPKEWDADLKAMAAHAPLTPLTTARPAGGWTSRVGLDVPRSPMSTFAVNMSAGMSSAFLFSSEHLTGFQGTPEEYAAHLASLGFDQVYEKARDDLLRDHPDQYDAWFAAMAAHGVKAGLNVEGPVGQAGMLGSPNLAFYSYNLPAWHSPLFRDYQLVTQHYDQYPAFAGIFTGADNAGYVPYWDWAPPIPNRPWGKAFVQWMRGQPLQTPVGPGINPQKEYEVRGTQEQFIDYIYRYDQTFRQYGYFASAVQQADPGAVFTIGSFGSSPGVGGRGGWPWASIPGEPLFDGLSIQTAYDWNETEFSKPMQNAALIDRLRSYYPQKTTWSIIDNFGLFLGREAMQRKYALALTRGVEAVGTNSIAHTTGKEDTPGLNHAGDREKIVAAEKELHAWIHRFGGAFAHTEPQAVIGILYVHDQAISRPIVTGDAPGDQVYHGSHEGKTTEALFLCHAAGWPARIITPEELRRAFPSPALGHQIDLAAGALKGVKVLLLTGLNRFDDTWVWYRGLEAALQKFVAQGGRILVDDESVCPVPAVKTGMRIAAYIPQGVNFAPLLFNRNRDNFAKLNTAMNGIAKPLVTSADPTIWAIPSQTGDVQYVTVVNWGYVDGQNASKVVKPQTGKLTWTTPRPIYDLPGVGDARGAGRRTTLQAASAVDLTHDAFHVYALTPAPVTAPRFTVMIINGVYTAVAAVGAPRIEGVPMSVTIANGTGSTTVYGTTEAPIPLPLQQGDNGSFTLTVTELLSGQSATRTLQLPPTLAFTHLHPGQHPEDVAQFALRKGVILTIALSPAQMQDPAVKALAERLAQHFRTLGRTVTVDSIEPGHVVQSLQPQKAIQRYPEWKTVDADLVLLGNPQNNILLFDQARGYLIPDRIAQPMIQVTHSPFVGQRDVLNILANDTAGLEAAVNGNITRAR